MDWIDSQGVSESNAGCYNGVVAKKGSRKWFWVARIIPSCFKPLSGVADTRIVAKERAEAALCCLALLKAFQQAMEEVRCSND